MIVIAWALRGLWTAGTWVTCSITHALRQSPHMEGVQLHQHHVQASTAVALADLPSITILMVTLCSNLPNA